MNKERVLLLIIAMIGVYLAGYYQITPMYLYSLAKSKSVSAVQDSSETVPSPTRTSGSHSQATPWPVQEGAK